MRVLLAEDEEDLNFIITQKLRSEGYSVDSCYDGEEALDALAVVDYDAIILDIMMPKIDGLEVLRSFRQTGKTTPVLFLTAKDAVPDRVKGLDSGANDYLVKPFELLELKARIRAVIRRYHGRALPQISIGALKIDPLGRRVSYQKTEVVLKPKEFDILLCIAQRHPAVVSSEEISEHVYDEDFDPFSSVLRVHLARLKKKLAEAAEKEVLKTIRAKGYQLCY